MRLMVMSDLHLSKKPRQIMYTYLRGFASGAGIKETLKALQPTDAVPPGQVFGFFFPADY